MSWVIYLIVVLVAMPVVMYALIGGWRAANWVAEKRCTPPAPEPVERLTANLRRLRAELNDTETRDGLTAKHHRVQALRGAYIDTLTAACQRLDVPPPPGDRAPLAEIYRVEAALRQRGLDVRETAAH